MTFHLDVWHVHSPWHYMGQVQSQGHRWKFTVTCGKCCWSGRCDLEWGLSSLLSNLGSLYEYLFVGRGHFRVHSMFFCVWLVIGRSFSTVILKAVLLWLIFRLKIIGVWISHIIGFCSPFWANISAIFAVCSSTMHRQKAEISRCNSLRDQDSYVLEIS